MHRRSLKETRRARAASWSAVICTLLGACAEEGSGGVAFRISGEEAARSGFPVEIGNDHGHSHDDDEVLGFVDDWTLTWDAYLVSMGRLSLASSEGETALEDETVFVVDLHQGDSKLITFDGLGARRWDRFGFAMTPPSGMHENVDADASTVQQMVENGWNYWIAGSASRGDQTVTFAWGIANPTTNEDCTNGRDDTQGLVVPTNKTDEHEITVHVEHAFWTSLGTEINEMRFDAIAAVADDDGFVSWEALAGQMLSDLRDADGEPLTDENGNRLVYDPGALGLPRNDLQQFIRYAMAAQAHFNGSGLCTARSQF